MPASALLPVAAAIGRVTTYHRRARFANGSLASLGMERYCLARVGDVTHDIQAAKIRGTCPAWLAEALDKRAAHLATGPPGSSSSAGPRPPSRRL